jgi:hypothetical protein
MDTYVATSQDLLAVFQFAGAAAILAAAFL